MNGGLQSALIFGGVATAAALLTEIPSRCEGEMRDYVKFTSVQSQRKKVQDSLDGFKMSHTFAMATAGASLGTIALAAAASRTHGPLGVAFGIGAGIAGVAAGVSGFISVLSRVATPISARSSTYAEGPADQLYAEPGKFKPYTIDKAVAWLDMNTFLDDDPGRFSEQLRNFAGLKGSGQLNENELRAVARKADADHSGDISYRESRAIPL